MYIGVIVIRSLEKYEPRSLPKTVSVRPSMDEFCMLEALRQYYGSDISRPSVSEIALYAARKLYDDLLSQGVEIDKIKDAITGMNTEFERKQSELNNK